MKRTEWRLAWLVVIPALALLLTWSARTADMYRVLGLRNLGDVTVGGITLHEVATMQYHYLVQQLKRQVSQAVGSSSAGELPRLHLFVQDAGLRDLDAALPASGFEYVKGRFLNGDKFSRVKVRYRGDFAIHWGFFKKSWRIKTKRGDLFNGMRKFNLIAPKSELMYANHFGYEMARALDLMAPKSAMVMLNLNGHDQGLYLLAQQIDESLLREQRRLPGDIYSGDEYYGLDTWHAVGTTMFETPGVWEKVAINNQYQEDNRYPLEQLLLAIKQQDIETVEALVDLPSFARLSLWENLAYSGHIDAFHNWRLYFDPGTARFYPILWDGMPYSDYWVPADWQKEDWQPEPVSGNSPIMTALRQSPAFRQQKRQATLAFLNSDRPAQLRDTILALNDQLKDVVDTDFPMDIRFQRIPPERAIARMKNQPALFDRIVKSLRDRYEQTDVAPVADASPATVDWSGTVRINADTVIRDNLVIAAGTRVAIAPGKSLTIHGRLSIDGSPTAPVQFESSGEAPFGAIVLQGAGANGSSLRHFSMTGGSGMRTPLRLYSGMLSIHEVRDVALEHCRLSNNRGFDDQLHVVYSSITIGHCHFSGAPMDAVDLDITTATVENSIFSGNGNDGLDLMESDVTANRLTLEGNGDKGISAGERSRLDVSDSQFRTNLIAIQVKDDSNVIARRLAISGSMVAMDAYAKNWRYGNGGSGVLCNSSVELVGQVSRADRQSVVQVLADCPDADGTLLGMAQ